mmetsp:Transcript_52261/g.131205  ORF Transcript_52261/g.131205 Transcript_52261/m.131205 type:complete len:267 (-) Transcript_52261:1318-2118(-)
MDGAGRLGRHRTDRIGRGSRSLTHRRRRLHANELRGRGGSGRCVTVCERSHVRAGLLQLLEECAIGGLHLFEIGLHLLQTQCFDTLAHGLDALLGLQNLVADLPALVHGDGQRAKVLMDTDHEAVGLLGGRILGRGRVLKDQLLRHGETAVQRSTDGVHLLLQIARVPQDLVNVHLLLLDLPHDVNDAVSVHLTTDVGGHGFEGGGQLFVDPVPLPKLIGQTEHLLTHLLHLDQKALCVALAVAELQFQFSVSFEQRRTNGLPLRR